MIKRYRLVKSNYLLNKILDWDSDFWQTANIGNIDNFHEKSSLHRPFTQAKLQYDSDNIYVIFKVVDKYILAVNTQYNSKVNEDSCVEWFVKPAGSEGYYNFELNAIGTLHVNYIVDPERGSDGKRKDVRPIPEEHSRQIEIHTMFKDVINNEIQEDKTWYLAMKIPFEFFKLYSPIKKINGSIWQGNLYKCGDKTSHPHWAAWSPVIELNFHQTKHFGEFIFND